MTREIIPSVLNGTVTVPPSKSYSHRALICAALAGDSEVFNLGENDDISATISCLKTLGAKIYPDNPLKTGKLKPGHLGVLDANESGSTLRFILPVALALGGEFEFRARGRLLQRPLEEYFRIFEKQRIEYSLDNSLRVKGKFKPDIFELRGNVSSQFISGLLFALPLLDGDSKIIITTPIESLSYIEMTIDALRHFGIEVEFKDREIYVPGNQKYLPRVYTVEGDFSQAAFFLSMGALGGEIRCRGLNKQSIQGDREIVDILRCFGADITETEDGYVSKYKELNAVNIDASQIPDLVPVLAVVAAFAKGRSRIYNAARLRYKESDRLSAIASELKKLGANIEEGSDYLIIEGRESLCGGICSSHGDHRIAMALAVGSSRCAGKLIIENSDCVRKSMPEFWDIFKGLGGIVNEYNLGK